MSETTPPAPASPMPGSPLGAAAMAGGVHATGQLPPPAEAPSFERFTLTDADGNPHTYELWPHPAGEGLKVVWRLVALGAEPAFRLASAALSVEDIEIGALMDDPAGIAEVVKQIDLGRLGADLRSAVLSGEAPGLTRELLRYTYRDGQQLTGDLAFNNAYARNYGELAAAAWTSVKVNRFFGSLLTS